MNNTYKLLTILLFFGVALSACTEDPEVTVGAISGYITEAPNGTEPLSGVSVSILSTGQSAVTSSTGTFSFTNLQPGSYSMQFKKTDYTTVTRSVSVIAGMAVQCDVQMSKVNKEPDIVINPTALNFGTTQTDLSVTVKNNGNATAEWALDLGNNPWLSASQLGGSIQAGRTQSVIFYVDRNYLSEAKTAVIEFQAFGNSYPINISCAPRINTSNMSIDPTTLDFGSDINQLTFTIRNTGKESLTWYSSGLTTPGIALSSTQGVIAAGGGSTVIVSLDRTILNEQLTTSFIISDGIKDATITINVNKKKEDNDPGGSENPSGENKIVVTNGLKAYYQFNGNFEDVIGTYDGFGINDPKFVEGIVGEAIQMSKSRETSVQIPYDLICNEKFTISFWAKDLADGVLFFSKCKDNNPRFVLSMKDGLLRFICSRYNNMFKYEDDATKFAHSNILDDEWHNIAITSEYKHTWTLDTWTTVLYIDGKRTSTITEDVTDSGSQVTYPTTFVVGGQVSFGSNYTLSTSNFLIENLRVYDSRILTAEEIKDIYNAKQ